MILSDKEKDIVMALCDMVYNNPTIKHPSIKRSTSYDAVLFTVTLGSYNVFLEITSPNCYDRHWILYVNGTKMNRNDDGAWWDIVRSEVPRISSELHEIWHKRFGDRCNKQRIDREYAEKRRAKELQRAEDYINGWRWWKFWWKRG